MNDKILQIKKEMRRLIKISDLTRLEKYNLLQDQVKMLDEKEITILINECNRDYESYNRSADIKDLVTICLTGVGMLITVFGIFFKEKVVEPIQFSVLLSYVGIITIILVVVLCLMQSYRSSNMNVTKHMLDILEEYYSKCFNKVQDN